MVRVWARDGVEDRDGLVSGGEEWGRGRGGSVWWEKGRGRGRVGSCRGGGGKGGGGMGEGWGRLGEWEMVRKEGEVEGVGGEWEGLVWGDGGVWEGWLWKGR